MRFPISAALLAALVALIPCARAADEGAAGKSFDVNAALAQQWKEKLGFTDGQSQKYSAAEKRREDALRPLRANLREALQKVGGLVAASAGDNDVAAALDELFRAQDAVAEANKKFDADLASFLSPTQRAKMIVGVPLGDLKAEGPADKRTANAREALTDGETEQE
jgi:Spy/CpxP family protein refolding chaperone